MYNIDVNEGGDCQLIRQFRLTDMSPDLTRQEQQALEKELSPPLLQQQHHHGAVDIPDGQSETIPEGKSSIFLFYFIICLLAST
jgi:hypothetical protein